jgi:hypothetical protein
MNILKIIGNKKVVLALFSCTATIAGIRYTFIPQRVRVLIDQRIAADPQNALKRLTEKTFAGSLNVHSLRALCAKEYPCVDEVVCSYKSSREAYVYIKSSVPQVKVTSLRPGFKEYVICADGKILETHFFSEHALSGLATVQLDGAEFYEKIKRPEFVDCVLHIKPEIFHNYAITWRSKSDIVLQARHDPIILVADAVTIHDESRFKYVHLIFKQENDRYKEGMKADIRIKEALICSVCPGKFNEKSVFL